MMDVRINNNSEFSVTIIVGDMEVELDERETKEITKQVKKGYPHKLYMELKESPSDAVPHIIIWDEDLEGEKELFEGDVGGQGKKYSLSTRG